MTKSTAALGPPDARDGLAVATVGRVCVVIWREAVNRPRFERQRAALASTAAQEPAGFAFLCVIEPTADPPDDQLRRASVDMLVPFEGTLRCVALVIEGSGFRAAIARSVVSGMILVRANRRVPVSALGTVAQAARFIHGVLPFEGDVALVPTVERLRLLLSAAADKPARRAGVSTA